MDAILKVIDIFLNIDKYLDVIIQNFGIWSYLILFLIIFCETGLVFTPFLPGDSILFAAGAFAALGSLNIFSLYALFLIAAIAGDTLNYFIGHYLGEKIVANPNIKFFNKDYLDKAQSFYDKHGSLTIVIGRFVPIIRTFVPFVAGVGKMNYTKFITYNIFGGLLWVSIMLGGGFFFGGLPIIKDNFSFVVVAIILISVLPAVFAVLKDIKGSSADEEITPEV